jgi:capsular exopolysaccharide synthesis family protein
MSKFFKALEQADRDRTREPQSAPERVASVQPSSPEPESAQVEQTNPAGLAADSADGVDDHLVSLVAPATFEAEQYRALRHTIEQLQRSRDLRVVAVSSPGVGDGKSITAINLAGALAQAHDARVLIVDADLRRPAVGALLALGSLDGPGLVELILDPGLNLNRVARPRPPFNLSVVRSGHIPASPYEVLKSPRVGEFFEEARHDYDYVVVDAPPLCSVQDCRIIAHWVDGFLLVVAAHGTPRRLIGEALSVVEPDKMLGIVFNGDDQPPSSYFGYYGYSGRPAPTASPSTNGRGASRVGRAVTRVGQMLNQRRRNK